MSKIRKIILDEQRRVNTTRKQLIERKIKYKKEDILNLKHIKVITGPRRAGKTSYAYLLSKKYNIEDVLFLSFDDERLEDISIEKLLEEYQLIYNKPPKLIIIDEVQEKENWSKMVKRLHEQRYNVIITGSNAKLLSAEISTYLAGRSFEILILPFSFREFLEIKGFDYKKKISMYSLELLRYYEEYIKYGGFYEVITAQHHLKREVIENIFKSVFYRDLAYRFKMNEKLLKMIIKKLVESIGKPFSISNLYKKIKAIYPVSKQTVINYYERLHIPYLTFEVKNFAKSFIEVERERKTYFYDNSIIYLFSIEDIDSRFLENVVAIELKRKNKEFYYFRKGNFEVDFVVLENNEVKEIIQVTYELNENNRDREIEGLNKA